MLAVPLPKVVATHANISNQANITFMPSLGTDCILTIKDLY